MENLKDNNIKLIDLSRKGRYKSEENNNDRSYQSDNNVDNQSETEKERETNNKFWQNKQDYILTDIPLNCDRNKIKGALKPYGKILDLQINQKRKWKSASVTIQKTKYSHNLENRWAIPLGNNMARIVPKENFLQILEERNIFSTRLYGIPKQTSTVILHQELKNLKVKTCFIPKCSVSGKNRSFAIISFEIQQELNKACASSIKYQNEKLTWLKSNRQYKTNQSEMFSNITRTRSPMTETMGYPK